jgi:hypothetical protein
MVKGKDSSCLCVSCESTNAIKCRSKAALKLLLPATRIANAIAPTSINGENEDELDAENDRLDCIAAEKLSEYMMSSTRCQSTICA